MAETIQPSPRKTTLPTRTELIVGYLQNMALPSMWPKVLSESDYELWDTVLDGYSAAAIKFSFDTWVTGAKRFPLPADIIPLCISYQEQEEQVRNPKYKRGEKLTGGHLEILAMWNGILNRKARFEKDEIPYQPLSDQEIANLVLDARAGRIQAAPILQAKHFPNGNASYNRELTQARVLGTIRTNG